MVDDANDELSVQSRAAHTVTAGKKDILLKQGDSYTLVFRIRDKIYDPIKHDYVPGDYKDLTGLVGQAQIRLTPGADIIAEFDVTVLDQSVDANRGSVVVKLSPQATTLLTPSPAFPTPTMMWEVELADNADPALATWRRTYLEGQVAVEAEVTK